MICPSPYTPWSISWVNFIYVIIHQIFEIVLYIHWSGFSALRGQGKGGDKDGEEGPRNSLQLPYICPAFKIQKLSQGSSSHNLISSLCLLNPTPVPSSAYICGYRSQPSSHTTSTPLHFVFPQARQWPAHIALSTQWLLKEMLPALPQRSENGLLSSTVITAQWKSLSPLSPHVLTPSLPPPHCCLQFLQ